MRVSISHIDTCFPEYCTDHHNRPGEILIGVQVDGTTTNADVKETLKAEAGQVETDDEVSKAIDKAVDAYFAELPTEDPFDSSLDEEPQQPEYYELPQAWFLIEYEETETPTEETSTEPLEVPIVDYSHLPPPNRVSINPIEKSVYMAWDIDFSILISSRGSICAGDFGTPPAFDGTAVEKLIEFLTKKATDDL